MDQSDFEGSLVLEKMAAIGKVDDFFAAVDADDYAKTISLMKAAGIDADTMAMVLQKMRDAE